LCTLFVKRKSVLKVKVTTLLQIERKVHSNDIKNSGPLGYHHDAWTTDTVTPNIKTCESARIYSSPWSLCAFARLSFWSEWYEEDKCGALEYDNDRVKQKYWEKNLSQCHIVHHKSHVDWPRIVSGPPKLDAGDYVSIPDRVGWYCVWAHSQFKVRVIWNINAEFSNVISDVAFSCSQWRRLAFDTGGE
jgi:hypothetical protein